MRAIPTIRTNRLTLRALQPRDFDRYAEIWQCAAGPQQRPDAAWPRFLQIAGHWQMTGLGQWAIEPHGVREMMGLVGFSVGKSDVELLQYPEVQWHLHPDASGLGLGQDAAQAAHDWFDRVITGPLQCRIEPGSARSLRLADALGYSPQGVIEENGRKLQVMCRKSPPVS